MLTRRNVPRAIGIDSGYTNTGVAVVSEHDFVLYAEKLTPPQNVDTQEKILWLVGKIGTLVTQYNPVVIGLETYTAPSVHTRAMSAKAVAQHNWLIGACTMLPALTNSHAHLTLLEAKHWQHQLTGIPSNKPIGGKKVIEDYVSMRTGTDFTKNGGGHKSDAAGIALIALDEWLRARSKM